MSTVQGGSPDGDKPRDVDPIQVELDRIRARQQRNLKRTRRILAVTAVAIVLVIGFATYSYIDSIIKSGPGDSDRLTVEFDFVNGTSNWTLIVTSSTRQFDLESVEATLLDESGAAQSPLSGVALSSLTIANWTTYHVRYENVNNETVVFEGARIVIDKSTYPRAYWMVLMFQSQVISRMDLG